MPLPNSGMTFTPFDPLTAAELNDMVENIEALAAGTGLDNGAVTATQLASDAVTTAKIADSAVTAEKLATNAITLGYAQITSNFVLNSSQTTPTQVTGLTSTVTIPSGGRRVKITGYCATMTVTGNVGVMSIWDGVVNSGTQLNQSNQSVIAGVGVIVQAIVTPTAGSKTYNIGVSNSGTSNVTVNAGATYPAYILVELI